VSGTDALEILFLDSWFADRARGSGSAVAIAGLAGGLRALGHRVTMLRPRIRLPASDLTRLVANVGYRRRVRTLPADLVVGFDLDGFLTAPRGIRYVVALKGVAADELRFERGWTRLRFHLLARLERANVRRADRVIATSEYSRGAAMAAYDLPPGKIGVVPEGIDVATWEHRGVQEQGGGAPVIVSVARQYPRKNTATLIRAMPRVTSAVPGTRLRIIGGGPEVPRLEALVRRLGLTETVELTGSLGGAAQVRDELARADVFCLPSRQEGFGIVFLEAMAAGLPIVAAARGAVPEVAPHGEVSLLVDPDDVEGLAGALVRTLEDPVLRRRLVQAGAARWRNYSWPRIAHLFLVEAGVA